jgi:hypothetical protein
VESALETLTGSEREAARGSRGKACRGIRYMIGFTWRYTVLGILLFLATFTVSLAIVVAILVLLPAEFLLDRFQRDWWIDQHPVVRWSAKIAKNVCGAVLVLLGIILSLPGVPGQGLLTILIGLLLLDFPGKRRLERSLIERRGVAARINRLRACFGRPPLALEEPDNGMPVRDRMG